MNNKVKNYYLLGLSIKELSILYDTSISEIANILDLADLTAKEIHTRNINVNARIQIELIVELNELNDRIIDCESKALMLYLRAKRSELKAALEKLA